MFFFVFGVRKIGVRKKIYIYIMIVERRIDFSVNQTAAL